MTLFKRRYRTVRGLLNQPTKARIEAAVRRGATELDKKFPGWAQKIKLTELNFSNGCRCVYGQLDSAYPENAGPGALILGNFTGALILGNFTGGKVEEFGYVVPISAYNAAGIARMSHDGQYRDLWAYQENCWRDAIRARRQKVAA
jgi:hypothetical protein